MTPAIAIVSHPACGLHDTGWDHPEHQGRLPAIVKGIYSQTPVLQDRWRQVEAPAASLDDVRRVHTESLIAAVRDGVERAAAAARPVALTSDTMVSAASWDAALGAVGAVIEGVRQVTGPGDGRPGADGGVAPERAGSAFVLSRPPGHHATSGQPMGFCLFNHVAAAARWAQAEAGVERVLIVDWDVHHGNGTQDIFYDDDTVHYLSFHLSPHYPGTGHADERGAGSGVGATLNVPFAHGVSRAAYLETYAAAVAEAFAAAGPDLVLVSAGFDCLAGDPLGGMLLEPADLHAMMRVLIDGAGAAPIVAALEGGYVPSRAADGAVQVVRALAGLEAAGASD